MRRALLRSTWNFLYGAAFGLGLVIGTEVLRGRLTRRTVHAVGRLWRLADDIVIGPGRWKRLVSYFTLRERRNEER